MSFPVKRSAAFDLVLAFDWEYDWDFIRLIESFCRDLGLRTLTVSHLNIAEALQSLRHGELDGRILFDRASGSTPDFLSFQTLALEREWEVIEPVGKLRWASDKATMHLELISRGLHTPYTIILPAYESERELPIEAGDLAPLGTPFVIKPANTTGGSLGVVPDARGLEDARTARRLYPRDKYLLQERVVPDEKDGRRFWFRGFYVLGDIYCAWWDDLTHLYAELPPEEVGGYGLAPLFAIVHAVADISGLRFFSTEIARDAEGRFLIVDYVNENCDMRLQSLAGDGVPDAIVRRIARRIATYTFESVFGRGSA
jgi:hypothetical protein